VQERIQKILARAGVASRRAAEVLIAERRVSVNGTVVTEPGTKADPETDVIKVDDRRLRVPTERVYLLLNKPRGYVTTRRDPEGRPTVMDLVPHLAGLFPVGRLDFNTEGLLLLTNDGEFGERVLHPRYEVPRSYEAKVRGVPDSATLTRLREGVFVDGERLRVDTVRVLEADQHSWLLVTLHEGKNHEVRRLLQHVGHPVAKLKRVAIGPLTARGLALGEFRPLSELEVAMLKGEAKSLPPRLKPPRRRMGRRPQARPAPQAGAEGAVGEQRPRRTFATRPTMTPPPRGGRPPSGGQRPPSGGRRPTGSGGQRPPSGGQRPTGSGSRPPSGGKRPPTGGDRPRRPRGPAR
jgi:pseudouridine synthase